MSLHSKIDIHHTRTVRRRQVFGSRAGLGALDQPCRFRDVPPSSQSRIAGCPDASRWIRRMQDVCARGALGQTRSLDPPMQTVTLALCSLIAAPEDDVLYL